MRACAVTLLLVLACAGTAVAKPASKPGKKAATTRLAPDAGVPDAGVDAGPVNTDPCARNPTCGVCVTSMTSNCGWCVDANACVYAEEGACGASYMAKEATQCPPPGKPRAPMQRADSMVTQGTQNNAPTNSAARGMPDGAFDDLLERLKEESNDAGKQALLAEALKTNVFSVAQIVRMLDAFDVTAARITACEALKDRVVDRKNLPQVYARFKSDAEKKRVKTLMESTAK